MSGSRHVWRERGLHCARCLVLAAIVLLIHFQHKRLRARTVPAGTAPPLEAVSSAWSGASELKARSDLEDAWWVLDEAGGKLGYVMQTSPHANHIVGFSGPTNVMLAFKLDDTLKWLSILSSEDTRDHVESIQKDGSFLSALNGRSREQILAARPDAVSGATLTCVAIQQSVILRLGGAELPGKFPDPITLSEVRRLFEAAAAIRDRDDGAFDVLDASGQSLGTLLRTSPTNDQERGYQGPSDVLVAVSADGRVAKLQLLSSFDNQPYVGWIEEDYGFPALFEGRTVKELSELDLEAEQIEGVAGATMTSMGIARSLVKTAAETLKPPPPPPNPPSSSWTTRDVGTIAVVVAGLIIGFTSLRGKKWIRIPFQIVLMAYLGLINGDMISQALLVGWSKNGVPWSTSLGLVVLSLASFVVPVFAGRNVYCSHLCPHGALQQLMRNRLPWRVKLSRRVSRALSLIPALLLLWVVAVAMTGWGFSLVDIEPFDAWLFRIAGVATIAVAIVGLVAAAFVPMAYCRFGCPTGALLGYVRRNRGSGVLTRRDGFAFACLAVGLLLFVTGA